MRSNDDILGLMRSTVHHPATARELAQLLRVPREERSGFRRQLKSLVSEGMLLQIRGNRFGLAEKMDVVVGRLQANAAGFGFVVPEQTEPGHARQDIFIAASNLVDAMHGDRVVARIERQTERGAEGRIIRILERSQDTVVGRFEVDAADLGYVVPFDRRVLTDIHVPTGQWSSSEPGEMVLVQITRWPTATRGPVGRVIEVLGHVDEPGVDTKVIIRKHQIPEAHSGAALKQARSLGDAVRESDVHGRADLRAVTTVTIDGEHARDFDDAITIERLDNGHYRLGVHIADVSHYVAAGSALDTNAYERGTSVYFPERAVHMFPAELATGLCSLNPQVDRLVQSCVMEVDRAGVVVQHELYDGVIHSDARLTYTEVSAILEGENPEAMARRAPLLPMLGLMRELFEVLHRRRRQRGAIDFDLPETAVILSEFGQIEAIVPSERNVAHRLIEEFMLLANETVAAHLEAEGAPALHRVHEAPDVKKVEDFEAFIGVLGHSLARDGRPVRPKHFQALIDRMRGTPEERPIAALMLRTMQKARYDAASLGHFGLAAQHYTHFTSPIRRYPDLVVHRALKALRQPVSSDDRREERDEELQEVARQASERERRADDAERELLQWKKVRFMVNKVGDHFHGHITGVAPFGIFVELIEHYVEGLVHISSMADDYYRFVEQQHTLAGETTKRTYRLGDRVAVQVVRVDMDRRQVDLGLVEILDAMKRDTRPRKSAASRTNPKSERRRTTRPGRSERAGGRRGKARGLKR
jgi:ribonuclease R